MNAVALPRPKPKVLLFGCGSRRVRRIMTADAPNETTFDHADLVTLDVNPTHNPDVVWDLENRPLPFPDNEFDEIHAYDVLEHIGRQGDWQGFFREWREYWRILKPAGLFVGLTPSYVSQWAWGDPSHVKVYTHGTLSFLRQEEYEKQVGKTPMSDFRFAMGDMDFDLDAVSQDDDYLAFVLRAKKPSLTIGPFRS